MTLTDERPKPVVFIIGAGLSGLLLAILLDRADIPFRIFERASTVKPLGKTRKRLHKHNESLYEGLSLSLLIYLSVSLLRCTHCRAPVPHSDSLQRYFLVLTFLICCLLGSVISIGPTILHVLDQLGLLEEMNKMSFPCPGITLFDGNMKKLGEVMTRREKDMYVCPPIHTPTPSLSTISEGDGDRDTGRRNTSEKWRRDYRL